MDIMRHNTTGTPIIAPLSYGTAVQWRSGVENTYDNLSSWMGMRNLRQPMDVTPSDLAGLGVKSLAFSSAG